MNSDNWKWWYYIVAGVGVLVLAAIQLATVGFDRKIPGEIIAALLAIAVGFWSKPEKKRPSKRPERRSVRNAPV